MSVTLRTYLLPVDGYCLDPTNPLRLSDGSISFAGVEQAPAAVADFLPPVLRQLTIFVADDPTKRSRMRRSDWRRPSRRTTEPRIPKSWSRRWHKGNQVPLSPRRRCSDTSSSGRAPTSGCR
ncbi:MAG: hypothetical protein WA944_10315 [Mycobacterium sp.]